MTMCQDAAKMATCKKVTIICNQPSKSSTWIAITISPPEHPTNPLTQFIVLREMYGKVQKDIYA